ADLLRRAMGKKRPEEMAKQRAVFVKGCKVNNNIPESKANQIFDLLEKFAGYGFNKSHAAAYAIVAYQTAFLKANYPVEFYCAMMTNDMADTAKLSQYIDEARGQGTDVLPPDVNESGVHFTLAQSNVARASRPCVSEGAMTPTSRPWEPDKRPTGGTPVPVPNDKQPGETPAPPPRNAIRFGLAAIKGIGEIAVQSILKSR